MRDGWGQLTAPGDDTAAARRYVGNDDQAVQGVLRRGYGRIPEAAGGIARMGIGAVEWLGSPVNATIHNFFGQPLENVTGIPSRYTDFAAGLALPLLKRLPGLVGPTAPTSRVPRAPPSPAADATETAQDASAAPVRSAVAPTPRIEPPPGQDAAAADQASAIKGVSARTAPTSVFDGANYSQPGYQPRFSKKGDFKGRKIDEVANDLISGKLTPDDVSVKYIVRDGNTLIMNTRSSQALIRAGIPRSQWKPDNVTGDPRWERQLDKNLRRHNLTSRGTPTVEEEPDKAADEGD